MSDTNENGANNTVMAPDAASTSVFYGVAAGDMTNNDAILWTRATDQTGTLGVGLTAQVSTDSTFNTGVLTYSGTTIASADYTLKLDATGLAANTAYYYRFLDGAGGASATGTFRTTPNANQQVEVKFGFSGDADGRFRPYPSFAGFGTATQPQSQNLSFFVFLGDTMYETVSTGSAAVPVATSISSTTINPSLAQILAAYDRKYLENISGVNSTTGAVSTTGQQGLQTFLQTTGTYTLLDNHELGNVSLQSGGAPLAAGARVTSSQGFDVNTTGRYDNQTAGYKTLVKAYLDYHPTRTGLDASLNATGPTVSAPTDGRSNGTPLQYFAQQQGANAIYFQLDDRSYRDARLGTASNTDDVTSGRQNNPNRTILGSTQLAWIKQSLLAAQQAGTPWKFISVSSPIDMTGTAQDGKSWFGGYAAERNDLLKFIADNNIKNVVFIATDDHQTRISPLQYQDVFGDASTTRVVPGAFSIVTGPIGAGGPDAITDHSFANIQSLASTFNAGLASQGEPIIGLQAFTGLSNVHRQGDATAGTAPSSVDFYSPDTFNYTTLDVSADGTSLTVDNWGIPSYTANTFPQTASAPTNISGFTLSQNFVAAAAPCYCPGTLILTDIGEVPVERLAIGDRVVTHTGAARPIRWIGRRAYAGRFLAGQAHLLPIRIAASALADGLPQRDLVVSPLHAMFIDGVLIPASCLVNGTTILQQQDVEAVTYIHVELDSHDVLLAEGAPSESFVDDDSRNMFHNAAEFSALYPDAPKEPARYCAPRVEHGPVLEAVRRRLAIRAGIVTHAPAPGPLLGALDIADPTRIVGWARNDDAPNVPTVLQVLDNGAVIGTAMADRLRPDVADAGYGDGRHGFEFTIPGGLSPFVAHRIQVRRQSDGAALPGGETHIAATAIYAPLPTSPCAAEGAVDSVTRDRILGWARGIGPAAPATIQVLDHGRPIARTVANLPRPDVAAAGLGDGLCGFDIALPSGLSPLERHVIELRREADGARIGAVTVIEPTDRFDAALEQVVSRAVQAVATPADQARVLSFLAAQADQVRQTRAAADTQAMGHLVQRRQHRADGTAAPARRRALVIDERVPVQGRDAGSQAMLSHIRALQSLGWDVSLAAADEPNATADALAGTGVMLCGAPFYSSVEDVLRRQAGAFGLVYLHRASIARRYSELVRVHMPAARLLYSVADLHHIRLERQAQVEDRPDLVSASRRLRFAESLAALSADAVLTHSLTEAALLARMVPQATIHHAPWAVPVRPEGPAFRLRRGLAFIGHYGHDANIDAAHWLVTEVMPFVWATVPRMVCHLVGTAMPDSLHRLAGHRVTVHGAVEDLHDQVLDQVRLTVAPLRFGAGVKGKVLESLAAGVPCVMTPVAAEGMALPATLQALIGRDAPALAELIVALHGNAARHRAAAAAARATIAAQHNEATVTAALLAAIEGRTGETPAALAG